MNQSVSKLSFAVEKRESSHQITPIIDGHSLIDLVLDFETARGFHPAGGYAGLIPEYENLAPLARYFSPRPVDSSVRTWVLGCDCECLGCWPLECSVKSDAGIVTWHEFKQPHRPEWDYSAFGPYRFDEAAYYEALAALP